MVPVLAFEALTLDGVLDVTLEADVLEVTLAAEALSLDWALEADDMPPLVDTLLVKTLSLPVLCLDPCHLSSWIGPMCMW